MPRAAPRPYTDFLQRRVVPILDVGLVRLLERDAVEVVAAVEGFDRSEVVLGDGTRLTPGAVVAATGYRPDLEPLLGQLGVLDRHGAPAAAGATTLPNAPGLFFIGFTNPISGNLREIGADASRIARAISANRGR
jgi:putative flavoprotein involved in K+ transport